MAGSESLRRKDREDRFVGALLGTAYGDALGAGVAGWRGGADALENGRHGRDEIVLTARRLALLEVGR